MMMGGQVRTNYPRRWPCPGSEAVAAALAEGIEPESVGEALALAAKPVAAHGPRPTLADRDRRDRLQEGIKQRPCDSRVSMPPTPQRLAERRSRQQLRAMPPQSDRGTYCVTPGVGNNSRVGKALYPWPNTWIKGHRARTPQRSCASRGSDPRQTTGLDLVDGPSLWRAGSFAAR